MTKRFTEFIDGLSLEHFRAYEFLINTDRPGNRIPPRVLWGNIEPTAHLLELLREHYGRPIIISSCYRAPEYNKRVGGTPKSQHQQFTAVDFSVAGIAARNVAWHCKALRVAGGFRGGIGSYNNFVHLDTRGRNATWRGK